MSALMSDLRQRSTQTSAPERQDDQQKASASTASASDSDEDDLPVKPSKPNEDMPQASDKTTEALDSALKDFSPRCDMRIRACGETTYEPSWPLCYFITRRLGSSVTVVAQWRNWFIRGIFTWVMILSFAVIIYLGPLALVLVTFALQIKCFHEIITIGYVVYRSFDLPWFRTLSWYFLFASNFFFFGESMIGYFGVLLARTDFLRPFMTYHRFISFSLYTAGLVGFVCSLVKKHYLKQFTLFGWTHVTLLLVVAQSHFIVQNVLEGLIWLLVPVSMIICNDIMAYLFGFFFGRTPLIKLSPKKTWEGFVGGAFSTIIFGIVLSYGLLQYDYFVCPVSYDETREAISMDCERSHVFVISEYSLPETVRTFFSLFGIQKTTLSLYPFILHSISMSIFASVIGPFGGFFASGFKRAFKIKDFGDTIPGHGGIMDRFDCQFLMATFVHVYYTSFVKVLNPQNIVQNVLMLRPDQQVQVFNMLRDKLLLRGLIGNSTEV